MAEYVTDTHPLLWYAAGARGHLSREAFRVFRRCEAGKDVLHIPAAVVWETAYLAHAGRIRMPGRFEAWWEEQFSREAFVFLPLDLRQVFEARGALNLGDFFDELIVGAARAQGLPLLTRDARITQSGLVSVRW
ncbi:MAG TPA: type II toxin-antitoxin system VapC family toxin [Candidatus Sulfotelmatobacter sp.]|nr:type II toxin-antitoxin system VapC family toxin [Candidatus Sulfotelmatobacter sp.]